ncbi:NADPH-ferredoxin reductase FprA [compost metagenome]
MSTNHPKIAILGSGPSGCYSAQFLRKKWPEAEITVFEALPVPYGLLRYGVATDHQGTKAVAAQFDRLFERDNVKFAGNVSVGVDLSFEALAENFDVVVRATGLRHDRSLSVTPNSSPRVYGAGAILKALNGFPTLDIPLSSTGTLAPLGKHVAVIGNGNVAMDVVRLLCKPEADLQGSDVNDERLSALRAGGIVRIDIFGSSAARDAKYDFSMLKEVLTLPNVRISCTGITDDDVGKTVDALKDAQAASPDGKDIHLHFHFCAVPKSIRDEKTGAFVEVSRSQSADLDCFQVDSVISATGFTNDSPCGKKCAEAHWEGQNVFKVGWLNRDGKGTIAENRKDAKCVTDLIFQLFEDKTLGCSKKGFEAIRQLLTKPIVDFTGWKRIDEYERELADENRCRRKITDVSHMLTISKMTSLGAINNKPPVSSVTSTTSEANK